MKPDEIVLEQTQAGCNGAKMATEASYAMCQQLCLAQVCNAAGGYGHTVVCEFNGNWGIDNTLATLVAEKCPYGGDFHWDDSNGGTKCTYAES